MMYEETMIVAEKQKLKKTRRLLREHMVDFLRKKVEPFVQESTYRSYLLSLNANFYGEPIADLRVSDFTKEELYFYYQSLLEKKNRKTVQVVASLVRRLSTYLYENGYLEEDVAVLVKLPREKRREYQDTLSERKRKQYFTFEDVKIIYDAYCNNLLKNYEYLNQYMPIVVLQLETFLRAGEVVSLFMDSVDFVNDLLHIRNTVAIRYRKDKRGVHQEQYLKLPKNGEERIVPLSPMAKKALFDMIERSKRNRVYQSSGPVYPYFHNGKLRSVISYERCFVKICELLSIDRDVKKKDCSGRIYGLNTHALRHTGITMANTTEGANITNTALMAGHSIRGIHGYGVGMEAVYTHALLPALREVKTPSMIIGYHEGTPVMELKILLKNLKENPTLFDVIDDYLKQGYYE